MVRSPLTLLTQLFILLLCSCALVDQSSSLKHELDIQSTQIADLEVLLNDLSLSIERQATQIARFEKESSQDEAFRWPKSFDIPEANLSLEQLVPNLSIHLSLNTTERETFMSYDQFIVSLGDKFSNIIPGELFSEEIFSEDGRWVSLDSAHVQVITYPSIKTREKISAIISYDGQRVADQESGLADGVHLWANGRLLIIYSGGDEDTQMSLCAILGEPLTGHTIYYGGYPLAVYNVVKMQYLVSSMLNPQIEVLSYQQTTWADSCLERPYEGEECVDEETPGWLVKLLYSGSEITYHLDALGNMMRGF